MKQRPAAPREPLEEKYDLKARSYDFDRAVSRVAEVLGLAADRVTACGKSPRTVEARALLCFWAWRKLGMSTIKIGRRLKISQPAASRLSKRGERIEKENRFDLVADKGLKT